MTSRKRQLVEDDDISSLMVVGYGARLFNPSTISEADKHMPSVSLPWDEDVEVDRFDCRLLLTRAPSPPAPITEDDVDFEEKYACDEERYRDLELYSSNNGTYPSNGQKTVDPPLSAGPVKKHKPEPLVEKPFVPPKNLFFPGGMVLPSTEKIGLVIEKTAQFVCKSGGNSEEKMLERAKSTPSLSFLLPNDTLHEYYNFIKFLIKDGVYKTLESNSVVSDTSDDDDNYINPLLMRPKANSVVGPQSLAPKKPAPRVQKPFKRTDVQPSELDLIKYFAWYNKFYDKPSPYYPNVTPRLFTPPKSTQDIIAGHVTEVLAHGHRQEEVIRDRDLKNSAHLDFKSPYYMFYQNMLYKKHAEQAPPDPVPFSMLVTTVPLPPTLNNTLAEFEADNAAEKGQCTPEPEEDVIRRRQLAHEAMNRILKNKNLK